MGTPGLTSHSLFLSLSLHEVSQKRSLGNPSTRSLWTTWTAAQTSSLCLCLKHPHCPCLSPTGSLTARLGTRTQGGHMGSDHERGFWLGAAAGGCSNLAFPSIWPCSREKNYVLILILFFSHAYLDTDTGSSSAQLLPKDPVCTCKEVLTK